MHARDKKIEVMSNKYISLQNRFGLGRNIVNGFGFFDVDQFVSRGKIRRVRHRDIQKRGLTGTAKLIVPLLTDAETETHFAETERRAN